MAFNLESLNKDITSELDAIRFLQRFEIIPSERNCVNGHSMKLSEKGLIWICCKKICKTKLSVRNGTWLAGLRIPLKKIIMFIYAWTKEYTTMKYTRDEMKISRPVAGDINNHLREVCAKNLLANRIIIGGPGTTVEIDHLYYSHGKHNKGKVLPEQWIFGGICRESKEIFVIPVPDRSRGTLHDRITQYISAGTTIISDGWEGYDGINTIEGYNFTHIVNDSENIVDHDTGAHTRMLESTWNALKNKNRKQFGMARNMMDSYMCEFMWRNRFRDKDLFLQILNDIKNFML